MKYLTQGFYLSVVISVIGATSSLLAQGTWTMQNPSLESGDLESIYFIDAQTGWTIGREEILKTNDGGSTWAEQNSGTSAWLLSIYFINANTGWTVGSGGTILKTIDGGGTWDQQTSGVTESLNEVYFADTQTGWVVGQQGTILHTTDGGSNWNPQTSGTTEFLYAIYFLDAQTGWAAGQQGIILHTTNGGSDWNPQTSGTTYSLLSVHFIDSQTGFISTHYRDILKTQDGGQNWNIISTGKMYRYNSIFFADAQTGWTVGEGLLDGIIQYTTDGGATWTEQRFSEELNSVHFIDSLSGWAAGDRGIIVRTTDGGSTWKNQAFVTIEGLFSTFFLNEKIGWAGGKKGTLLKTIDSGLNWEQVSMPSEYRTYYQIYFADSQTGWICGSHGKVTKTVDGGTTWTEKSTSTDKAFHDICFINSEIGWVVGGGSVYSEIFRTSDGGNSWELQVSPAEKCLFGVHFINSDVGWSVGMDGAVLNTTDGGANWQLKNNGVPADAFLEDVYFHDNDTGFVVGEAIILRTMDGGENWTEIDNISGWLEKIVFVNENIGWILGTKANVAKGIDGSGNIDLYGSSGAKVWKTTDGGINWVEELLPIGRWILDAYFADLNSGWGVGSTGNILKYSNSLPLPSPPTDLTATGISESLISLSWTDNSANEDGFHIYRSDSVSGDFQHLASAMADDTDYVDTDVINGTTYWYFIRAFNETGSSAKTLDAHAMAGEPAPVADFSADITSGDLPMTVYFTDHSTGNVSGWSWDFGDGDTSTQQNPSHTYSEAGTYDVSLTATGAGGSDTETKTGYITVIDAVSVRSSEYIPDEFVLNQNYPNPFNPSTFIKFTLEKPNRLSLKIYDLNGQEIETLMEGFQTAGEYQVEWQPSGLSGGVYFYRLQVGEYSETRKLIFQ